MPPNILWPLTSEAAPIHLKSIPPTHMQKLSGSACRHIAYISTTLNDDHSASAHDGDQGYNSKTEAILLKKQLWFERVGKLEQPSYLCADQIPCYPIKDSSIPGQCG